MIVSRELKNTQSFQQTTLIIIIKPTHPRELFWKMKNILVSMEIS